MRQEPGWVCCTCAPTGLAYELWSGRSCERPLSDDGGGLAAGAAGRDFFPEGPATVWRMANVSDFGLP